MTITFVHTIAAYALLLYLPTGTVAFHQVAPTSIDKVVVSSTSLKRDERAAKAKDVWKTVAFAPTPRRDEIISLDNSNDSVTVLNEGLFEDFKNKIKGTFFINGLSSCQIGRYTRQINPMESHGYVKSLAFDGKGSLHLKASIVETPLAQAENRLKCPIARGVMSSLAGTETALSCLGNALAPTERDTANLVATLWPPSDTLDSEMEPVLIVAGDNGAPYCINPKTMESMGKLSWHTPDLNEHLGGKKMMAHMRYDAKRQRLILCSTSFDLYGTNGKDDSSTGSSTNNKGNTMVEFMEFDKNFQLVSKREFMTRFMVFHDWMITDNYYVIPKNPARVRWADMTKFIMGAKLGVDVFEMDEAAPGELILIPRHDQEEKVKEVKADSFFNIFHVGPCYENNDKGELVVLANVFDKFRFGGEMGTEEFDPIQWSSSDSAPPPQLDKFVVDIATGTMKSRERISVLDESTGADIPLDMPTFHEDGAKTRYSYFAGASRPEGWFPFRSIVKVDLDFEETWNWDAGDDCVVSEPTFIPRPATKAEDDGFVVSIVHNTASLTCDLVIWDSTTFQNGPIGIINLGELMPWCVHGCWTPDYIA